MFSNFFFLKSQIFEIIHNDFYLNSDFHARFGSSSRCLIIDQYKFLHKSNSHRESEKIIELWMLQTGFGNSLISAFKGPKTLSELRRFSSYGESAVKYTRQMRTCACVCVCGILIVKSQIYPLKDASNPITPLTIGILKSISYYNMQICHQEIIKTVIF